jgi:hypothetical protein
MRLAVTVPQGVSTVRYRPVKMYDMELSEIKGRSPELLNKFPTSPSNSYILLDPLETWPSRARRASMLVSLGEDGVPDTRPCFTPGL